MERFRLHLLWCIAIVLLVAPDIRSNPTHRLYTTDDGLPSTFVKHTLQLPCGHIAISTDHGIAIYDGYQFHHVHLPDGMPDSYVKQLFLDQKNRLFAATDRGLAVAEACHDRVLAKAGANHGQVMPLAESNHGRGFAIMGSSHNQPPAVFTSIPFHPPDGDPRIRAIHQSEDGRIHLAGQNTIYQLTETLQLVPLKLSFDLTRQNHLVRSFRFVDDGNGGLLIISAGNNLLYLAPGEETVKQISGSGLPDHLYDIKHAGGSSFWIGSTEGLHRITWDAGQHKVTGHSILPSTRNLVIDNIAVVDDNTLYAGTEGSGLYRIHTGREEIDEHRTFLSNYIKHVYIDRTGNRWISTDHGIAFIANMSLGNIGPDDGLPRRYVTDVMMDGNDNLWIATYEGFFVKRKGSNRVDKKEYLDQQLVYHAWYCREHGIIYAYTQDTIHSINTVTLQAEPVHELTGYGGIIQSVVVEHRYFWLLSNLGRLMLYDKPEGAIREFGTENGVVLPVSAVARTEDGTIWIGGASGFLARYNPADDMFVQVSTDLLAPMPSSATLDYLHSGTGSQLWIGTSDGLYLFQMQDGNAVMTRIRKFDDGRIQWIRTVDDAVWIGTTKFLYYLKTYDGSQRILFGRRFTTASGLVSTNFSHGAAFIDDYGYLWMGTNVGIGFYNNGEIQTRSGPVALRYWKVGDSIFTTTEERRFGSDTRSMSFAFTTLDFPSDDVIFQYQMAGIDMSWHDPVSLSEITRYFDGAGTYTLLVRASRNSTDWSQPLDIQFVILPPWWRGLPMIAVYLFLLGAMIFGLVRWKSERLRIQNRRLEEGIRSHTWELKELVAKLEKEIDRRQQVEEKLREANRIYERMIKIVSHDLRTPMQGILGYASMLRDDFESFSASEQKDMISQIISSCNLTVSLLNQLLEWMTLQSGTMPFEPSYHSLSKDVDEITELLNSLAGSKNISVKSRIPEDLLVYADRNMLQSTLRNLVSNAIKFTGKNGEIVIQGSRKADHVEIRISDNGVGMEQETLEKILAREKTVTSRGTGRETGSGLGLVMSMEMIQRHGGMLTGKSEVNKGATFTFTLPDKGQVE